jgi:hypothetical protein
LAAVVVEVAELSLVGGAVKLLKKAENWYTIAYRVDEDRLVVRGRRGPQQFMAVWRSGKADCAYWWTRQHEAWADLPRQQVRWETPTPTPVKVGFRELRKLLQREVELPYE